MFINTVPPNDVTSKDYFISKDSFPLHRVRLKR